MADDPVRLGLVASLARPGGNLTGVNFLNRRWGQAAGAAARVGAQAARIAVLVNPTNRAPSPRCETWKRPAMGLQIQVLNASTSREIDAAFATFVRERPDALFVARDAFFTSRRVQLVTLTAHHGVPARYPVSDAVEAGGLMGYGATGGMFRQAGVYTGRVLKGARPADLPVVQSTKSSSSSTPRRPRLGIEFAFSARPRRRGDRINLASAHACLLHLLTTACGTNAKC